MKINFATFGDGGYAFRAASKRLTKQALSSGVFDRVSRWSLRDIDLKDPDFLIRQSSYIKSHPQGLGNFIWKPKVFLEELKQMNQGDLLVMIDAGCQLNLTNQALLRFDEYLAEACETGGVFMQLANGSFGIPDLSDSSWTKLSLLKYLDPDSIYGSTGQVQAGIIIVQKNQKVLDFSEQWMEICQLDNNFFLSSPQDFEVQAEGFQSHRWEQSVFSLLVKRLGFTLIKDETYFAPDWSNGNDYPIWAMRNRSGGDAYRRHFFDLTKIGLAKISRKF